MSERYGVHPVAEIFPGMSEVEFRGLVEDVREHGQREPIVLVGDRVLDGRHRLRACAELGLVPSVCQYTGETDTESLTRYVVSLNLHRRHLNESQRALCAAKAGGLYKKDAAARQAHGQTAPGKTLTANLPEPSRGEWRQKASEPFKVSARSVQDADRVLTQGTPELVKAVEEGRVSVSAAAKVVKEDAGVQRELVDSVSSGREKNLTSAYKHRVLSERVKEQESQCVTELKPVVHLADIYDYLDTVPDESVDLLLTDPPYMTDVVDIDIFSRWVHAALGKVKSTGRAYIFTGSYPLELYTYLMRLKDIKGFVLENVLVWTYRNVIGPAPKMGYRNNWQAIFYLRGEDAGELDCPVLNERFAVHDVNAPDGRLANRYHAWQKPMELAERLVRHSTKPGDTVLDPFACTGTFLLAATKYGRKGIGCDNSAENLKIAEGRGCEVVVDDDAQASREAA